MDLYQAQRLIKELGNRAESLDLLRHQFDRDQDIQEGLASAANTLDSLANDIRQRIESGEFD
jgi:hypothetical protein